MSELIGQDKKPLKKTGLGRGLGSLLGSQTETSTGGFEESLAKTQLTQPIQKVEVGPSPERINQIQVEQIYPNETQPRKQFQSKELGELAASIRQKGILQPIVVRKISEKKYEIIAGERRWRAAQLAGKNTVPAIVKDADTKEVLELALIENIQRQDLNPIEEAEAYQHLIEKYNMTQQDLADRVGKDRVTVANLLRLSKLDPEVRELVKTNQLTLGQAKVLLSAPDLNIQKRLARKSVRAGLSVRALERLVKRIQEKPDSAGDLDIEVDTVSERLLKELALELQKELGTKVNIEFNGKTGKLSIDFYSIEALNSIADRIRLR
jgi:ParB family chromosome partitioning protein